MWKRDLNEDMNDTKAKNIKQAWQQSVAEVQRAQMSVKEKQRYIERDEDLDYGQNLIKQLGYRKPQDKKPNAEPTGTLYDEIFKTKVHKSVLLA